MDKCRFCGKPAPYVVEFPADDGFGNDSVGVRRKCKEVIEAVAKGKARQAE